mmetsp:Transcript_3096/g.11693  ORF Transcript_3096/g.11693 Transcript_3096/m.11693 type:complete len:277 (-) Transcript_3096:1719-2549(-)
MASQVSRDASRGAPTITRSCTNPKPSPPSAANRNSQHRNTTSHPREYATSVVGRFPALPLNNASASARPASKDLASTSAQGESMKPPAFSNVMGHATAAANAAKLVCATACVPTYLVIASRPNDAMAPPKSISNACSHATTNCSPRGKGQLGFVVVIALGLGVTFFLSGVSPKRPELGELLLEVPKLSRDPSPVPISSAKVSIPEIFVSLPTTRRWRFRASALTSASFDRFLRKRSSQETVLVSELFFSPHAVSHARWNKRATLCASKCPRPTRLT